MLTCKYYNQNYIVKSSTWPSLEWTGSVLLCALGLYWQCLRTCHCINPANVQKRLCLRCVSSSLLRSYEPNSSFIQEVFSSFSENKLWVKKKKKRRSPGGWDVQTDNLVLLSDCSCWGCRRDITAKIQTVDTTCLIKINVLCGCTSVIDVTEKLPIQRRRKWYHIQIIYSNKFWHSVGTDLGMYLWHVVSSPTSKWAKYAQHGKQAGVHVMFCSCPLCFITVKYNSSYCIKK